jgi:hypothetical protein
MSKALLLRIDGSYECVFLKTLEDYYRHLGKSHMEVLPLGNCASSSPSSSSSSYTLLCSQNEERRENENTWSSLLKLLFIPPETKTLYGDILIMGNQCHVADDTIKMVDEYSRVRHDSGALARFVDNLK